MSDRGNPWLIDVENALESCDQHMRRRRRRRPRPRHRALPRHAFHI